MPKSTKMSRIATEVAKIVGQYCTIENEICTTDEGKVLNKYKIWDSSQEKWFEAPTLDEVFAKFKESRGLNNDKA